MAVYWRRYDTARYLMQSEECPLELQTKNHHTLIQFLDILPSEGFLQCIDGILYEGKHDRFLWLCLYRCALAGKVAIVEDILETYESEDAGMFTNVMKIHLAHYIAGLKINKYGDIKQMQITSDTHPTMEVNDSGIGGVDGICSPTSARIVILRQLTSKHIASQRDSEGRLPLWYAAQAGNTDLIPVLMESYRHDCNEEDINSAIYASLSWKHPATVSAILYHKPDLILDERTKSCMIKLIDKDWNTYSKILLECRDMSVSEYFFSHACRLGEEDKMNMMLEYGVDINHQDLMGLSALHEAAQVGQYAMVQGLLDAGADVNIQDCRGDTPLHHVCMRNTVKPADNNTQSVDMLKTLQVLISSNTLDFNLTNIHGHTALVEGIVHNNKGMVEYLLQHSIERLQLDLSGTTGISYIHSMLLDHGTSNATNIPKIFRTELPTNVFKGKGEIYEDSTNDAHDLLAHFKCLTCDRHFAHFGDAGNCHKNFVTLAIPKRTKIFRIQYRCEQCHEHMKKDNCYVHRRLNRFNYGKYNTLTKQPESKNCYYCHIHFKYKMTAQCLRHNLTLTRKIYIAYKLTRQEEQTNRSNMTQTSAAHRMGIQFNHEHEW